MLIRRLAPALAVVLALGITACGEESGEASSGSSSTANDRDTARLKFRQCMKDNGVELPERGQGGGGVRVDIDQDKLEKAMEACAKYREEAMGEITAEQRQELQDAFVKFRACMREHGIDLPDMTPGGGPPAGDIDRSSPRFQDAMEACQDELPERARPGGER